MTPVLLSVRHIQQRNPGECLAVCAAMVLDYMGLDVDYARLLQLLRITEDGTLFSYIREIEKLGVSVIYKQGTLAEIHEHLSNDRPCIALVATGELPYWNEDTDHALVVVGPNDQHVYVNDPGAETAPIAVTHGDFDLAWLARDELYATFLRRE